MLQDRLEEKSKVSIMLYIITVPAEGEGDLQVRSSVPPVTVGTMYIEFEGGGTYCLFNGYTTSPDEFKVVRPADVALDATAPEDTYFVTLPRGASMIRYKCEEDGRLRAIGLKTSTGVYEWSEKEPSFIDKLVASLVAA